MNIYMSRFDLSNPCGNLKKCTCVVLKNDFPVPLSCESIKPVSPVTMVTFDLCFDSLIATKDAGGYHRVVISTHCRWDYLHYLQFFFCFFVEIGEMKLGDRQNKN